MQKPGIRSRTRRLCVDVLETRNLLAGLDVLVFEDLDGSGSANDEVGVAGHVVFVDTNRDALHNAGEPIAITNTNGIASFAQLNTGLYSVRLLGSNKSIEPTTAAQAEAEVGATQMVSIGLRSLGGNTPPRIDFGADLKLDEDTIATLGQNLLRSISSDIDQDTIHWVIIAQPTKGILSWSADEGSAYIPFANANGTDSFWIAAFDGANLSSPVRIPISIAPINDPPTNIELSQSVVDENIGLNEALATVSIVDPDQLDSYQLTVNDPRFRFQENRLVLADGFIDYENEYTIPLVITATNRSFPSDRITRTIKLDVIDRNDPPRGLNIGNLSLGELSDGGSDGVIVGSIGVSDPDSIQNYAWTVSDSRFEVRGGSLVIKPGNKFDYESERTVEIAIRALDRDSGWTVSQTVTVTVIDQNDPPTGILVAAGYDISENVEGAVAGFVYVEDVDYDEEYVISTSDPRFEVVDNTLKLTNGTSLTWEEPGFIVVGLTAVSLRNGNALSASTRINIIQDETPYHNDQDPADVDGDGEITPLDPLIIVNYINNHGPGVITPEGEGSVPNMDVDGDGLVTPVDILIIINLINQNSHRDPIPSENRIEVAIEAEGEFASQNVAALGVDPELDLLRRRRR